MRLIISLTLLLVISFFGASQASAQNNTVAYNVVESLIAGNADGIADYFGDRVEITLFNKTNIYSSTQARYAVEQFFDDYKASGFTTTRKGQTGGTYFILGNLQTDRGLFSVNVYIETSPGVGTINRIRFENH